MTYSSALFRDSQQTLRDAQNEKYRALAASTDIGPDDHVLKSVAVGAALQNLQHADRL